MNFILAAMPQDALLEVVTMNLPALNQGLADCCNTGIVEGSVEAAQVHSTRTH